MRAVTVAVGGVGVVVVDVYAGGESGAELGVSGDTGVDDVGGHTRAVAAVGVGTIEGERDLIDAIDTPRRAGLGRCRSNGFGDRVEGDDPVGFDVGHPGPGLQLGDLSLSEIDHPAIEDLIEGVDHAAGEIDGHGHALGRSSRVAQANDVAPRHHVTADRDGALDTGTVEQPDATVDIDGGDPRVISEVGGLIPGDEHIRRADRVVACLNESAGVDDRRKGELEVLRGGLGDDEHVSRDA